ncbi:MAG: hypothetical protein IIC26_01485 [Chloroflexi bacterium]|nr:hypothetical protein [Chloroflexota bacterium]
MEILGGLGFALFPLVIIVAIVAAAVAWSRREGLEGEREEDRGIGTAKRLYFYGATFVFMLVAGAGVVLVADYVLDDAFGPAAFGRGGSGSLALGVVLAFVWTPVWAWHRLRVMVFAGKEPAERRSILRKIYVYLTLGVTAALVAQASVELLRWVFGSQSFNGYPIAALLVWGGLWAFHWLAEEAEGQPTDETRTVRRLYLYATSAYSLTMLATGLSIALYLVFREAYDGLVDLPLLTRGYDQFGGDTMRNALAVAFVGAGLWAFHWLYAARDDAGSDVRQFYSYVLAILGGVITVLVATAVIVFGVLQWLIGTPDDGTAAAHFRFLPGALSALIVGLGLWLYHWDIVRQERAAVGEAAVARRVYAYIMAALGLGALAAGMIVLVPTVIGIAITSAREVAVGVDWWRDRIVTVLTLGLIGGSVWGYYWFAMQRRLAAGGDEERTSLPRRMLVYGVIGVGALAILGSMSHILFLFLDALLEDGLSLSMLRDMKWSIGIAFTSGLFVPYHWLILQEDRKATGESVAGPAAPRKSVTVLVGAGGGALVSQLEASLGGKVRVLRCVDANVGVPELSAEEIQDIERRVTDAEGSRVLLIVDAAGVQVYSYR